MPYGKTCKWLGSFVFLSVVAAAITSLFVARDALNFGIIQIFLMITLIIGAAAIAAVWKARRQF